jgi:hypothetical protein
MSVSIHPPAAKYFRTIIYNQPTSMKQVKFLLALVLLFAANITYAQSSLKERDKIPLFVLKDQNGVIWQAI